MNAEYCVTPPADSSCARRERRERWRLKTRMPAAISLAQRVAAERGEHSGKDGRVEEGAGDALVAAGGANGQGVDAYGVGLVEEVHPAGELVVGGVE